MARRKITARKDKSSKKSPPKNVKKTKKNKSELAAERELKKAERKKQAEKNEQKRLEAVALRKITQMPYRDCLRFLRSAEYEETEIRLIDAKTVDGVKVCAECEGKLTDGYCSKNHSYYHQDKGGHVCPYCVERIEQSDENEDNESIEAQLSKCWFACIQNFTKHLNRYEGIMIGELKRPGSAAHQKALYNELMKPRLFHTPGMMDRK